MDEGEERRNDFFFFNAIVSHYQAGEVAFETLCAAVCFMREQERAALIRSPKCKSSRGVNHVALRLKTVGVINHLGAERRIFSAFHRVAVYITLRHFFLLLLLYPPCENHYFNAIHRIFTACNCLPYNFRRFRRWSFMKNCNIYDSSIILRSIFRFPLFFLSQKNISLTSNNINFFTNSCFFNPLHKQRPPK